MAEKIRLTRPELKRQRDRLTRFRRYLPMLKLKQQQLQMALRVVEQEREKLQRRYQEQWERLTGYSAVLNDWAGVPLTDLARPSAVHTGSANVAGVQVPVFAGVEFSAVDYSLFSTPVWLDRTMLDLRALRSVQCELEVLLKKAAILRREFLRTMQRVNLFEKVKIPEALEAMRIIRIHLGDEMAAAVGRAKIAKGKLAAREGQA